MDQQQKSSYVLSFLHLHTLVYVCGSTSGLLVFIPLCNHFISIWPLFFRKFTFTSLVDVILTLDPKGRRRNLQRKVTRIGTIDLQAMG